MKVYIFLLILLLPNISIAKNINIYKECESFFSTSYQEKIKEHTKKFVFTHEFATIDSIHLKIQKGNTSSLAYIDNKDIIFNKNIFSLLCKRQLDILSYTKATRGKDYKYNNLKKITKKGSIFFQDFMTYWKACLSINMGHKSCNEDHDLVIKSLLDKKSRKQYFNIMEDISIMELSENVLEVLSFITLHEIGHIEKGHQLIKNNINHEFEADEYALERVILSDYDFGQVLVDILFLPVFHSSTKSSVEKLTYNSPDLNQFSECRSDMFILFTETVYTFKHTTGKLVLGLDKDNIRKLKKEISQLENELPFKKITNANCKKYYLNSSKYMVKNALEYLEKYQKIFNYINKKDSKLLMELLEREINKYDDNIYYKIHIKNIINIIYMLSNRKSTVNLSDNFLVKNSELLIKIIEKNMGATEVSRLYAILAEIILYNKNIKLSIRLNKSYHYANKSLEYNKEIANSYYIVFLIDLINENYEKSEANLLKSIFYSHDDEMTKNLKLGHDYFLKDRSEFREGMLKIIK